MSEYSLGGLFNLDGFELPRIGYGMGGITRKAAQGESEQKNAIDLLQETYDLGIRHFDTAQFYGNGLANTLLKSAFSEVRENVFIASKVGARAVKGMPPMAAAQKPHELREAIESNLKTLNTDYLDMIYMRRMDFQPSLIAEGDQQVELAAQLDELNKLREEGKIRGIGLSHVTLEQVQQALDAPINSISNIYTMLHRQDEPLLALARENDVAWAPYFPLGGASYADLPRVAEHGTVQRMAKELDATPTQVAIKWQLAHSPNTLLITGTASHDHLHENVAAADLSFSAEQFAELENLGL